MTRSNKHPKPFPVLEPPAEESCCGQCAECDCQNDWMEDQTEMESNIGKVAE